MDDSRFIISKLRRLRYRTLRALDASYWSSTWGSAALHPSKGRGDWPRYQFKELGPLLK